MLFKVHNRMTGKVNTVYAVKHDNFQNGARFLIYDQESGWNWINSAFCAPVEE